MVFGAVAASCSAWRLATCSFSKSRWERRYSSTGSDHLSCSLGDWQLGYSSALQPLRHGLGEVGRRRYTLQTSTAPPSTVMDVPVAIGCCIAYT